MKQEKSIVMILCIIGISAILMPMVSAFAANPAEDGKWDFTITDIRANNANTSENQDDNNAFIEVGVTFEGTEPAGTADIIFMTNDNSNQFTKTISDIKQNETRWVEFEHPSINDCELASTKVTITTPGFRGEHTFDEKMLFFVPHMKCSDSDGVTAPDGVINHSDDLSNHIPENETTNEETNSAIESFTISHNVLEMKKAKIQYVTISGNIVKSKYLQGHDLRILMTKPDGIKDNMRLQVTSEGKFETVLRFDFDHSMTGKYTFEPTYMEKYNSETKELLVTKSYSR